LSAARAVLHHHHSHAHPPARGVRPHSDVPATEMEMGRYLGARRPCALRRVCGAR
jgi:hypothetical protein